MKNLIIIVSFFCILNYSIAQNKGIVESLNTEKNKIENCYSLLQNDTLTIGNSFIERKFKWNNGNIISTEIINKVENKTIQIKNNNTPDFNIKVLKSIQKKNNYTITIVNATPIITSYVSTEIITEYKGLEVKQVFKIFPSSMGICCEYYLKKTDPNLDFKPDEINIEQLSLNNIHWNAEAVEFIDCTDDNNTFVKKESILPFHETRYVGNIIYLSNLREDKGIFLLKESPVSGIQVNYPGYDFLSETKATSNTTTIKSVGLGVRLEDLISGEWIKTFSYVLGVHNTHDLNKKIAIRSYQNNIRIFKPERDGMMMVNTWGDRNKDAKLNEKFILDELKTAHKFGFTHYQIDDGWQQGLSMNSAQQGEQLWDQWSLEDWQPNKQRFPNGFKNIKQCADSLNIKIGLWFHPSNENNYRNWEQDADILIALHKKFGINNFKIDGVKLPTKEADLNLARFFNKILTETNYQVVFNLDATADNRYGYHYNNHLGNIFLENRYTDWKTYYPYQTLRNIWMLSEYVPSQKIQLEFLNKWRNQDLYANDPFGPANYSFDYLFAITMPGQPLAWFETTGLPSEADKSIDLIHMYRNISAELNSALIFPIGNEPNGTTYTGFQFIISYTEGYILIFRELNNQEKFKISALFGASKTIFFNKVYGDGQDFIANTDEEGKTVFIVKEANSFCLYKYRIE